MDWQDEAKAWLRAPNFSAPFAQRRDNTAKPEQLRCVVLFVLAIGFMAT